jgi:hypothetical protein
MDNGAVSDQASVEEGAAPPKPRVLLRKAVRENSVELLVAAAAAALEVTVSDLVAALPDREEEQKRLHRVFGNTLLLGLIFALVPALVQFTKPWWVAGVGGWIAGLIGGVWIMLMFLLDGPVKKRIEDLLATSTALPLLLSVLAAVGLFFGAVYATQPRPDDPVVCIVTSSRNLTFANELPRSKWRLRLGDEEKEAPGAFSVLVGKGAARRDWIAGGLQLAQRLEPIARSDVGPDPDPRKADSATESLLEDWLEKPEPVELQPKLGDILVISLVTGSTVRELRRHVVRQNGLQVVMIEGGTQ